MPKGGFKENPKFQSIELLCELTSEVLSGNTGADMA